jgi:hypothetical protein
MALDEGERRSNAGRSFARVQGVIFAPSQALTPPIRGELEARLSGFFTYLLDLGYRSNRNFLKIRVEDSLQFNAYFSVSDGNVLVLAPDTVVDPDVALHEYSRYVMMTAAGGESGTNLEVDLEIGLADYFVASFRENPRIGAAWIQSLQYTAEGRRVFGGKTCVRNLDNHRRFDQAVAQRTAPRQDSYPLAEFWGGAFWEMRALLGRDPANPSRFLADRLLYNALLLKPPNGARLVRDVLRLDRQAEGERNHAAQVRAIFARRGLQVPAGEP